MKKILGKITIITSILGLMFFYGCSEDGIIPAAVPDIDISLSATTSDGTALINGGEVNVSDTFSIIVSISAEVGFNTLNVSGNVTSTVNRDDLNLASGTQDAEVTFNIYSSSLGEGSIDFEAVDEEGNTATTSFSFIVVSPAAKIQTAVILYAPLGDLSSETFYSIENNETYSRNEVESTTDSISASIDFGYYYGTNDNASLASPAEYSIYNLTDAGWTTRNATILAATSITSAEYLEMVTVNDLETAISGVDVSNANGTVTSLSEGDILMFKTVDDVQGLIQVSAISGTDGSDGMIELEIKLAVSE
ncbi:MAG: hypothetical protein CMB82_06340 [Flammeovirgaceae bacterium]|nr:hypothetical protein [Flammeovirgaceae bacterium]